MTFAQRRNHLMTHFSEGIPVAKRRISLYIGNGGVAPLILSLGTRLNGKLYAPAALPHIKTLDIH